MTIILVASMFSSCCKEDIVINDDDEIIYAPELWQFALHQSEISSNSIIRANLIFDKGLIIATTNGTDNRFITFLDFDGNKQWSWNDIYQAPTERFDIGWFYALGDQFTYQVGSRSYYIDLTTGESYLKIRRDVSFDSELTSFGDEYYFVSGFAQDSLGPPIPNTSVGYRANILTGEFEEFLYPHYDQSLTPPSAPRMGDVTAIIPIIKSNSRLLFVVFQQWVSSNPAMFQTYVGLLDYDENSWIYTRETINDPIQNGVLLWPPQVYEDKVFMNIGKEIVGCDLNTGGVLWRQSFTQDFLFSGLIVGNDLLFANCEDTYLYCLRPASGEILWKEKTAGTSSSIRFLNGIIYLSGGSTGRIHAIDTDTGKTVWRLDPTKYKDGSDDFKADLYVIPGKNGEKGKVIIQTHRTAYCVEAYR